MAAHLSIGVVDDAVLVVSAKELQAAILYRIHLRKHREEVTVVIGL